MHQFQVGAAADGWRNGGPTGPLLERIAKEETVRDVRAALFHPPAALVSLQMIGSEFARAPSSP